MGWNKRHPIFFEKFHENIVKQAKMSYPLTYEKAKSGD